MTRERKGERERERPTRSTSVLEHGSRSQLLWLFGVPFGWIADEPKHWILCHLCLRNLHNQFLGAKDHTNWSSSAMSCCMGWAFCRFGAIFTCFDGLIFGVVSNSSPVTPRLEPPLASQLAELRRQAPAWWHPPCRWEIWTNQKQQRSTLSKVWQHSCPKLCKKFLVFDTKKNKMAV